MHFPGPLVAVVVAAHVGAMQRAPAAPLGGNLYAETPASGEAVRGFPQDEGMGDLLQGSLEASNVEIVQEMVDMITSMRAYEINSKAIKNSEEMMDIANQMIR